MFSCVHLAAVISLFWVPIVSASPADLSIQSSLLRRQAPMPTHCTNYTSVAAGSVCIIRPTDCTANYTVESDDSCNSVVAKFNSFTATQLWKWNPEIGQTCMGLRAFVPICISAPGYTYTGQPAPGVVVDAAIKPVPIFPYASPSCLRLAYIAPGKGPFVSDLFQQNSITAAQYLAWNVGATDSLGNPLIWAGYWVCVRA